MEPESFSYLIEKSELKISGYRLPDWKYTENHWKIKIESTGYGSISFSWAFKSKDSQIPSKETIWKSFHILSGQITSALFCVEEK